MLVGKCPKCGVRHYGWALKEPRNQMCPDCGVGMDISDESGRTFSGYSPFTAEEYKINLPQDVPYSEFPKDN